MLARMAAPSRGGARAPGAVSFSSMPLVFVPVVLCRAATKAWRAACGWGGVVGA